MSGVHFLYMTVKSFGLKFYLSSSENKHISEVSIEMQQFRNQGDEHLWNYVSLKEKSNEHILWEIFGHPNEKGRKRRNARGTGSWASQNEILFYSQNWWITSPTIVIEGKIMKGIKNLLK